MAIEKWKNLPDETTPVEAENLNNMKNVELIAVSNTSPSTCIVGDMYFNTTSNKIYTATENNTWGATGENAISGIFYIVISEERIYYYNGTTLINIDSGFTNNIGQLSDLNTTDKENLVSAINEVKNIADPNVMSLGLSDNFPIMVSTETVINFNTNTGAGTKLAYDSTHKGVKIGAGVSKVKVNFNVFSCNNTDDWLWIKVFKNGVMTSYTSLVGKKGAWSWSSMSPAILNVKENDYIQLIAQYGTANSENYIRNDGSNFTVEVI